jgi:hypothetical protein
MARDYRSNEHATCSLSGHRPHRFLGLRTVTTSFVRRYNDDQREAIYRLKRSGKSGADVARLCARGVFGLEPFEVDRNYANRIARDEAFARQEDLGPAHDDPHQAFRAVVEGMIEQAERWLGCIKRRAKIDPMEFKRMVSSMAELRKMLAELPPSQNPNGTEHAPQGFYADLAAKFPDDEEPNGNGATQGLAPGRL